MYKRQGQDSLSVRVLDANKNVRATAVSAIYVEGTVNVTGRVELIFKPTNQIIIWLVTPVVDGATHYTAHVDNLHDIDHKYSLNGKSWDLNSGSWDTIKDQERWMIVMTEGIFAEDYAAEAARIHSIWDSATLITTVYFN